MLPWLHERADCFPIHNEKGELFAYAGRSIDESEPKYKFPAGFHKSLELYNLHRAIGESNSRRRVVVVDGSVRCCGIVAQADLAMHAPEQETAEVVKQVSQPTEAVAAGR